jgi:DNA (cytosine-5)-methyltransferase 1
LCAGRHRLGLRWAPELDFLVRAEEHGVPQARHRVIILGIRKDVFEAAGGVRKLRKAKAPKVLEVIGDLPTLRPELSFRGKGMKWVDAFSGPLFARAVEELKSRGDVESGRVAGRMLKAVEKLKRKQWDLGSGDERIRFASSPKEPLRLAGWFQDRGIGLLANHESRSHMPSDLVRYLFVSTFGEVRKSSPGLPDFPACLLPKHKNVDPKKLKKSPFKDRFRVQVGDLPAMTITSHIAKDGHAFIHPEPAQCRSLTVREAARLQTFPDSYVFLGTRTSQFTQVGNAVPPYLAQKIASIVAGTLTAAGLTNVGSMNAVRVRQMVA